MKNRIVALALTCLTLAVAAPLRAESLDGTHWRVHPYSFVKKMMFWSHRTLVFDAGQVTLKKGAKPVAYTTSQENGKTTWKAELTTAKGDKVSWTGTVDGDQMTGATTRITVKGKTMIRQWQACQRRPRKHTAPSEKK